MANPPAPAEGPPPDRPTPAEELIASPPEGGAIVEDTAHATIDADRATTASQFVASQAGPGKGVFHYEQRYEAKLHVGPFPDPETLRELAELYPEAPRLIFEDFHAQSAHRRDLERAVITTKNTLAIRGQMIAGTLGGLFSKPSG